MCGNEEVCHIYSGEKPNNSIYVINYVMVETVNHGLNGRNSLVTFVTVNFFSSTPSHISRKGERVVTSYCCFKI